MNISNTTHLFLKKKRYNIFMFQEVKTIYNFYKSNIQKNKLGFYIFILVILTIISSIINSIYPISIGLFFDLISSKTDNLYYIYNLNYNFNLFSSSKSF